MPVAASCIALHTIDLGKRSPFTASLASVLTGGGLTRLLITQGVLEVDPWYQPSAMFPLAGMIFGPAGLATVGFLTMIRKRETLARPK